MRCLGVICLVLFLLPLNKSYGVGPVLLACASGGCQSLVAHGFFATAGGVFVATTQSLSGSGLKAVSGLMNDLQTETELLNRVEGQTSKDLFYLKVVGSAADLEGHLIRDVRPASIQTKTPQSLQLCKEMGKEIAQQRMFSNFDQILSRYGDGPQALKAWVYNVKLLPHKLSGWGIDSKESKVMIFCERAVSPFDIVSVATINRTL